MSETKEWPHQYAVQRDWFYSKCVWSKDYISDGFWYMDLKNVSNRYAFQSKETIQAFLYPDEEIEIIGNPGWMHFLESSIDTTYRITPVEVTLEDNTNVRIFSAKGSYVAIASTYVDRFFLTELHGSATNPKALQVCDCVWIAAVRIQDKDTKALTDLAHTVLGHTKVDLQHA
jgi:hypothetical protein